MDNFDEFLESLSLDPDGISRQFMSFSSFFNILFAAAMGFLILTVYLASSNRQRRDRNLYMVIPVLSVLMAVIMRIEGPQAISFFGIFGIMSIIRFRSEITDQKGITFILFAVIEGVIVGVNAYLLAIMAWAVVSGAILIGRYLFNHRVSYRLALRLPGPSRGDEREDIPKWFSAKGVSASFSGYSISSEFSAKNQVWEESGKVDFILFPKTEKSLIDILPEFIAEMQGRRIEADLKRQDLD